MVEKRGSYSINEEPEDSFHILAVTDGNIIPIEDVPDEVFSQKMVGDGFAIQPESEEVVAPITGKLIRIAETYHVFYIEVNQDLKVMVHVGIDTLMLHGEGFHSNWKQDEYAEAGEVLLTFDRELLEEKGYNPVISVVIIDNSQGAYQYKFHENGAVEAGKTVAMELSKNK